jgi:hypothetical protein
VDIGAHDMRLSVADVGCCQRFPRLPSDSALRIAA